MKHLPKFWITLVGFSSVIVGMDYGVLNHEANSVTQPKRSDASIMLAPTPPMGWNSYDCYGGDVNEQEVKANSDYVAEHLARYCWKYIVVDYYWYYDSGTVKGTPSMDP